MDNISEKEKYYEIVATEMFNRVSAHKPIDLNYTIEFAELAISQEKTKMEFENIEDSLNLISILYNIKDIKDVCYREFVSTENIEYYKYLSAILLILQKLKYHALHEKNSELKEKEKNLQEKITELSFLQSEKIQTKNSLSQSKHQLKKMRGKLRIYRNLSLLYAPENRLANFFAYEEIFEITAHLKLEKINAVQQLEFCDSLINPYLALQAGNIPMFYGEWHLPPTLMYLKNIGISNSKIRKIEKESENLDNVSRLKLGLKINENCIRKIRKKQDEIIEILKKS